MTKLFVHEQALHEADDTGQRLQDQFSITSPALALVDESSALEYNVTGLAQVFGEYFAKYSIADDAGAEGGPRDKSQRSYVPRAGYIGTLAPGERFQDDAPIAELPKKILHPWPAMQELPFHVRWPVTHPMVPPPLLWMALNNMYTEVRASPFYTQAPARTHALLLLFLLLLLFFR
jgi:hypothetical protein